MTIYNIELTDRKQDCLVSVSKCNIHNLKKESHEQIVYPSKRKACESIKYRFNDLDFETDILIFNGIEVNSSLDLIKLMDKDFLSEVPIMMMHEYY